MSKLRYLLPNAATCAGIAFAALSVQQAVDGHYRSAAWWAMYCVLTDKVDGALARRLRASSAFGAQLDSFADFFSFGVAPAVLFYAFFSNAPGTGWNDATHRGLLSLLSIFYLVCVAARLARFNVTHELPGAERFFFGWPTTYNGGVLAALFALCLKYGDPAWTAADPSWDHTLLLGSVRLDRLCAALPWLLLPSGLSMVSTLRMPKVGTTGRRWLDALMYGNMVAGYACGLVRLLPEYLVFGGVVYFVVAVRYHLVARAARAIKLPPLFDD